MAAPKKYNLNYFPFEVGFFEDDKIELIEAEFGHKGIIIAIKLLCKIYRENGYYYQWGDDQCLLFAKKAGDGIVPKLVTEVVQGLVKRSFFDERVFNSFGILTSKGIQERYSEALKRAKEVAIIQDYLCENVNLQENVTLIALNVTETNENVTITPQIKEKKKKVNKKKGKERKIKDPPSSEKSEILEPEEEIVSFLNEFANRSFKMVKSNFEQINGRLKEGWEIEQLKEIIQAKTFEWNNDPEMEQYLNPTTLFRKKNIDKYWQKVLLMKQNPEKYKNHFKNQKNGNSQEGTATSGDYLKSAHDAVSSMYRD